MGKKSVEYTEKKKKIETEFQMNEYSNIACQTIY